MKQYVVNHLNFIDSREHRKLRRELTKDEWDRIYAEVSDRKLPYIERYTRRIERFLETETPVLLKDTEIQIIRTLIDFPDIYAPGEMDEIKKTHFVHEKGKVCNIACDYETLLKEGFEGRRARLLNGIGTASEEQKQYAAYVERLIDATERFTDRYAELEEANGMAEHAQMMRRIVRNGAETLLEAMQLFRIAHFVLWCSGAYHCTVGRFDQYMLPFYEHDKALGMTDEDALALVEDFFLSFNRDSDLYYSLMWGDNGQSLVLGGCKSDGTSAVNPLTYMAIQASLDLHQIDPKLNLRCDKNTPQDLYELGTHLTKAGMGFPQYANDDVIIPGLVRLGYDLQDAREYVTAACWEFIIPKVAMDIPNIGAMSLAEITRNTITENLMNVKSFDELKECWRRALRADALRIFNTLGNLYMEPAPYHSILMSNCMEEKRDISLGSKYNNFGFHGTGFSSAVDQMMAVKKLVFEDGTLDRERLLRGLESDYENDNELKYMLRRNAPKLGRDIESKELSEELIEMFSSSLEGLVNERGGIVRGGTGSAMYYLWHSEHLGATSDGRSYGEPLPANYSPALFITEAGLFSVITGFTQSNLSLIPNGGPFTLELHDTVFNAPDSIEKVAMMVKMYIDLGGHQMQLNSVNNAKLRDAQIHPEKHQDLVVRVWGWSGHFVELEKRYQDQIISRTEFAM